MLRRHSKRTEDKSRGSKTSLRLQTKWQGQTSEAKARHKLRVCQGKYSLALPLAPFHDRYLGLIKYQKSRVLLYGAPTACMMMPLVRHSSLELFIRSGDVHCNPGPETSSYNTLFGEPCSVSLLWLLFCIHRPLQSRWAIKAPSWGKNP